MRSGCSIGVSQVGIVRRDEGDGLRLDSRSRARWRSRDRVKSAAGDVLHRIEVGPPVLAGAEHGHDVWVMQSRGRPCLALEPLAEPVTHQAVCRQHLERHVAAKRLLNCFVHNAHATFAKLPEDAVLADATRQDGKVIDVSDRVGRGPEPLDGDKRRKEPVNVGREGRVFVGIGLDRRSLAATQLADKLFGQLVEDSQVIAGWGHC